MSSATAKCTKRRGKPVSLAGFLLSISGLGFVAGLAVLPLVSCTLYSNADREAFNAKVVVQNPAGASFCRVSFSKPRSQDLLTFECFSGEATQTIVRVSR